jgi:hypothetical protein
MKLYSFSPWWLCTRTDTSEASIDAEAGVLPPLKKKIHQACCFYNG